MDPLPLPAPAFGLIIIGDEILSGKRADKHLPKAVSYTHLTLPTKRIV